MAMNKQTLAFLLPYLRLLDRHPAMPAPVTVRASLKLLVDEMSGLPDKTIVSEWVERQLMVYTA